MQNRAMLSQCSLLGIGYGKNNNTAAQACNVSSTECRGSDTANGHLIIQMKDLDR